MYGIRVSLYIAFSLCEIFNINNPVDRCRVADQYMYTYCVICWWEIANSTAVEISAKNSIFRDYISDNVSVLINKNVNQN